MKAGTRVLMKVGPTLQGTYYFDSGRVIRRSAEMGQLPSGYVPVKFDDGTRPILVHEDRLQVAA